ncbi:potassium voltage-gated channel subfamily C member 1-like [Actinia tenebrosa]|uniref:Potassium voltage-gated channel subfamily C member 1-like n=1 Tax=Actinia tenebrosa TaxID=6105 RepID=A0A6P8I7M2_ACTTE|nr:potassium voltage-gated channel subfamily C member 1-like [Actinia tenebrosa]
MKNENEKMPGKNSGDRRLVINVGGRRYETFQSTLTSIPDTRLAWIAGQPHEAPEYDKMNNEFFFDRHSGFFEEILNYYRTGKLHCPRGICGTAFEEELSFWGIDEEQMEACCWPEYTRQRTAIENLRVFNINASQESINSEASDASCKTSSYLRKTSVDRQSLRNFYRKVQPWFWRVLEEPFSSVAAKVTAFVSLAFILLSVLDFILSSLPVFPATSSPNIIEYVCGSCFTFEFVIRLLFCPSKIAHLKKPMTWVDVGALVPFYLQFVINAADMERFKILIMFRLLRIFRLFRFSYRLQIMVLALKGSLHELGLLLLILAISVVFFSTLVFYADGGATGTKFVNIPTSFWWAIITLTTVGYGDDTPVTWPGRVVSSACALWGVLMITLPISIVNSNFSLYYAHAKAMLRLPKKVVKDTFPPGTKRYLGVLSTISEMNLTGRLADRELKFREGIASPSQSNINLAVGALRMSSRKSISTKVARMKRLGNNKFQLLSILKPSRHSDIVQPFTRYKRNYSTETVNIGLIPAEWDGELEDLYGENMKSEDEVDSNCGLNDAIREHVDDHVEECLHNEMRRLSNDDREMSLNPLK